MLGRLVDVEKSPAHGSGPRPGPPKATAIAREGALDEATAIGESVFEIQRQGIPEIMRQTEELANVLADFKPAGSFLEARTQRRCAA